MKKRKDENELLNITRWCVKVREGLIPDGPWVWAHTDISNVQNWAIQNFCDNSFRKWDKSKWTRNHKAGVVACVKVKLVEQP